MRRAALTPRFHVPHQFVNRWMPWTSQWHTSPFRDISGPTRLCRGFGFRFERLDNTTTCACMCFSFLSTRHLAANNPVALTTAHWRYLQSDFDLAVVHDDDGVLISERRSATVSSNGCFHAVVSTKFSRRVRVTSIVLKTHHLVAIKPKLHKEKLWCLENWKVCQPKSCVEIGVAEV